MVGRLARILVGSLLTIPVAVVAMPPAAQAAVPEDLTRACVTKNGSLKYTATANCGKDTLITFSVAAPTVICVMADGSVRKVAKASDCSKKPKGTPLTVPSNTPAYFCVNLSGNRQLLYVGDPSLCREGETAVVLVNHAPTDIALSATSVAENVPSGTVVGTLSAVDADLGDSHTFSLVSGTGAADNASFSIVGNQLQTAAAVDFETQSSYSIRIGASDLLGLSFEKEFTITVDDVVENDPPTDIALSNDTVAENQPAGTTIGTLTTTDPDAGDTHTYSLVAGAGDADNSLFAIDGSVLETDAVLDFEDGPLSIRIQTDDGNGGIFSKQFAITVTDAGDAPTAIDDTETVGEDSSGTNVDILANDTDQDNDALTVSAVDVTGTAGTVTNNGTDVTYDPNGQFENLALGESATDTFTYTVSDGNGGTDTATVTITVSGANDAPNAVDDAATVAKNDPAQTVTVRANDNDPDSSDTLTVTAVDTTGTSGTVTIINAGGAVSYDPNGQFAQLGAGQSATDTFTYTVSDGNGGTDTATVTITVTGANAAPSAVDDAQTVGEDSTGASVDVLANDSDDNGDTLTVTAVDTTGTSGTVTNNGTDVTYDPNGQFEHLGSGQTATDTFTYTVSDGNGGTDTATATITISGANDAPGAVDDSTTVGENSSATSIAVLANDTDAESSTLTVFGVDTTGTSGVVTIINAGGSVSYDPNDQFESLAVGESATDTFTYTVSDGNGGTDTATVTITVEGANDSPNALADAKTVGKSDPGTTIDVLANDTDPDGSDTLVVSAVDTTGTSGTVTNNGTDVTYDPNGAFDHLGAGATATDTFTYTASDGNGGTDTAIVSITVNGGNAPPVAAADTGNVGEDSLGTTVDVLANDTDTDGDALTVTAVDTTGTSGTVTITNGGADVSYDPNGQFEHLAVGETANDTFTYTASDGTDTDTATVTITVTGANDGPSANNDDASVGENSTGTTVTVLGNDTDPDASDILVVSAVDTTGTLGTVTNNGTHVTYSPNGQFDALASGQSASDTFTYTASDDNGGTDTATVTITVTGANDAPTDITLSNSSIDENLAAASTVGTPSATDTDTGDTHTFALVAGEGDADNTSFQIVSGVLKSSVSFNYEVKNSYSIRLRATDSSGATFEEVFTISINDVNDAPTAANDSYNGAIGNTLAAVATTGTGPHVVLTGNVILANDSDEDGDTVAAVPETVPSTGGGTATINSDGSFLFLPGVGDKNQSDTFTYQVSDGLASSSGTVTVIITDNLVWYVDDSAAAGGDGRSTAPLQNVGPLTTGGASDSLDGAGDWIFLYSGTYTGGLALEASQKLYGEPAGLEVAGHTLATAGGTNPTIGNAGGIGITLAEGTAVRAVNVNGTGGAGISASGVNTATVGGTPGGSTTVGTTGGAGIAVSGGNGNLTFDTGVTAAVGAPVSVTNRTGGTVAFTGTIDDTGTGISLTNNTGATITFTGAITLSTGSNPAFTATGGGTVTVTGTGNTLTTTTGTALRVENTTIANGLQFRSISSNGAVNGIKLVNTGSTAAVQVFGNTAGTCGGVVSASGAFVSGPDLADCSGGSILNSSGAGILLDNVSGAFFQRMRINGGANDGIAGTNLRHFTLRRSVVTANGNAAEENGIDLGDSASLTPQGAVGFVEVSQSTITGSADSNFILNNSANGPSSQSAGINLTGNRIANADSAVGSTQDNIQIAVTGAAAIQTMSVTGNSLAAPKGDQIQVLAGNGTGGQGGFIHAADIKNNTMTGGAAGALAAGVTISAAGQSPLWAGLVKFDVDGNVINGAVVSAVTVSMGASGAGGSFNGFVRNNTIGTTGQALSCSAQGNGMFVKSEGSGTMTIAIQGNTLRRCFDRGIDIAARDGNGVLNATVTGNTVTELSDTNNTTFTPREAFQLVAGSTSTNILGGIDSHTVCLSLTGNSLTGGVHKISDIRARQRFRTRVNLPGYGSTAFDTTAVQSLLSGANGGATATATANDDGGVTTDGYFNSAACTLPTP